MISSSSCAGGIKQKISEEGITCDKRIQNMHAFIKNTFFRCILGIWHTRPSAVL